MCENLTRELKKLGHEVIAVSLYTKKTPITDRLECIGTDIRYLDKKAGLDISMFAKLKTLFEQEKPDVVHTHLYAGKYVFPAAAAMKIKAVHTIHSVAKHELGMLSRKLNGLFFRRWGVVPVALSTAVQQTVMEEYKLPPERVPVVMNGIDLSKCRVKTDYNAGEVFRIVHVGNFSDVKNHKGLVEAFEVFNKKHPDSRLHLIGDGKNRQQTEQSVRAKGLEDKVIFHGVQADVHKFISQMDVFVLSSLYEGVPMSIAEAMGSGMPVVATAVGGVPDMLDQSCAKLVPESAAIAEALEDYYQNSDLRKSHGEKALKKSGRFCARSMAEGYMEIYCQKCGR